MQKAPVMYSVSPAAYHIMHHLRSAITFSWPKNRFNTECNLILQNVTYCRATQCLITRVHHMRERKEIVYTGREKTCIMTEPGAKLRPGVRLFPGGCVILLPTRIMAIMKLAEMAHCRYQCSARVMCQVGKDMPEKQAGKQAENF